MTINITVDLTPTFANHNLSFSLEGTPFAGEKTFSMDDPLCTESELKAMLSFLLDKIYGLNTLMKFSKNESNELYINYYEDENTPKDNSQIWMVAIVNFLTLQRDFLERLGDSSHKDEFNQHVEDLCSSRFYSYEEWIDQYLRINHFLNEKIETVWPKYVSQWAFRSNDGTRFNSHFLMFDFFFRFQEILHSFREKTEPLYLSQLELFPLLAIFAEKQVLNIIKKMNENMLTRLLYQQIQDNLECLVVEGKTDILASQAKTLLKALCFVQFDIKSTRKSITKNEFDHFVKIKVEDKHQLFKSTQALASENNPLDIEKLSNKEKSTYLLMSYLNAGQEEISNQNLASLVENFSYYWKGRQSSVLECLKFIYCSKYPIALTQYFGRKKIIMSMNEPISNFIFDRIANPVVDLVDAYVESDYTLSNLTDAALENGKAIFKVKNKVFNFADFNQNKLFFLLLECIEKIKDAENKNQKIQPWLSNFLMLSFSHLSEEKKPLLTKQIIPLLNNLMIKNIKYTVIEIAFLQAYFLNQVNRQFKSSTEECRLHLNLFVKFLPELITLTQSKSSIKKKKNNDNELIDLVFAITKSLIKHSDNEELASQDTWKDLQELDALFLKWKNDSACKEKLSSVFVKLNSSFNPQASKNIHSGIDDLLSDLNFLKSNKSKPKSLANKPAVQSKKNKSAKKKVTKAEANKTPKTQAATPQDSKNKKELTSTNKEPKIKQVMAKPGSSTVTLFSKPKVQSKTKNAKLNQALPSPIENKKIESNNFDAAPILQSDEDKKNEFENFEVTSSISQGEQEKIPSIIGVQTFFNKREIGLEPTIAQFYDIIKKGYPPLTWRRWEYRKELNPKVYCKYQLGINDKAPNKGEWFEIYFKEVVSNAPINALMGTFYTDPKNNQQYQAVCMQISPEKIPCNYPLSDELKTDIFNHYLEYDLLEQFVLDPDKNEPEEFLSYSL